MSAIDWTSVSWWDLPGPAGFLEAAVGRITSDEGGIVGLSLPERRPTGLMGALKSTLESERALRVVVVDPSALDAARSPAHALAAAAGASPGTIRSTSDFVRSRDVADMVFIVDTVAAESWSTWSLFCRSFRAERLRAGRITAPTLLVVVPRSLPQAEIVGALGGDQLRWRDVISRADMQLYVESVLGRSSSLASRTAAATIAEVACWDPDLASQLAPLKLEDQIDPRGILGTVNLSLGFPSWANGLVDVMDGAPHVHTLALLGEREVLARRLWRAHVGAIFPTIEQVRQTFVRQYFALLQARLPFTKSFNNTSRTYTHPLELEINEVHYFLKDDIERWEADLLYDFKRLRTSVAHMEPVEAWRLVRASRGWDAVLASADAVEEVVGWDWPRCGQRLVLLVGPSGAGKSTYAAANYPRDAILSSDAIREELFGTQGLVGSQDRVFETLRERARRRLSSGQTVVVDSTNLKRHDRLSNVDLVPDDIAVEYVLIDRPMVEKERDGGWRLQKPGLLATHARIFASELADVLNGDGLPNVTVTDRRTVVEPV